MVFTSEVILTILGDLGHLLGRFPIQLGIADSILGCVGLLRRDWSQFLRFRFQRHFGRREIELDSGVGVQSLTSWPNVFATTEDGMISLFVVWLQSFDAQPVNECKI